MKRLTDINVLGEERRRKKRAWFGALFLLGGWVLIFSGVWMVRWSGLFAVEAVRVEGLRAVSEESVRQAIQASLFEESWWKSLLGMQSMLVWPETLEGDSLRTLPAVKEINFSKRYQSREIVVRVSERVPIGIWCVEVPKTECFWFDEEGVAMERAFDGEGSLIALVRDRSGAQIHLGGRVLEARLFINLKTALEALEQSAIRIKEVRLEELALEEVTVFTHDGPRIYVSLRFPLRLVEETLRTIQKEVELQNITYVDLRVEGRAYYK